ncbi:hypothetical protein IFM89_029446, partial [Coptis chinensis]
NGSRYNNYYKPRVVKFSCQVNGKRGNEVVTNEVDLPQFSSATVPKIESSSGNGCSIIIITSQRVVKFSCQVNGKRGNEVVTNEVDLPQFSSATVPKEWMRDNNYYKPRVVKFSCQVNGKRGNEVVTNEVDLPQFSSAAIPKIESSSGETSFPATRALKKNHSAIRTLIDQSGFGWDNNREMVYADDDQAHPDFGIWRTKSVTGYEDLCIIFGDGGTSGKYSRAPSEKVLNHEKHIPKNEEGSQSPLVGSDDLGNNTLKPINLDSEFEACAQLKKRRPKMMPNPHETKKSRPKSTVEGMVDVIQSMATTFTEIANNAD